MKWFVCSFVVAFAVFVHAAETMKMNFNNEEITRIVELYSKASGQKFIVDPAVRGKISIFNQESVSLKEAFNQISTAMALNGFAIVKEADTMVVLTARNAQRSLLEVTTEVPELKPQRLVTWMVSLKHMPVQKLARDYRIFLSSSGEMQVSERNNQLIITDWTTNLHRMAALLKEIDKPVDPAIAKVVEMGRKESEIQNKKVSKKPQDKLESEKEN